VENNPLTRKDIIAKLVALQKKMTDLQLQMRDLHLQIAESLDEDA
jgi:hypothetical protein